MRDRTGPSIAKYGTLSLFVLLSFVPLMVMLFMSMRDTVSIYTRFWAFPWPPKIANYTRALTDLWAPAVRTIILAAGSILGIQIFGATAAYGFARIRFPGKEVLFYLVIILMMIPGVLVLTPNFILASRIGLRDSLTGLGVFYIAGGQVFAIFLLRAFFQEQPEELFESARLDGAGELRCLWHIGLPLSVPILITLGIMEFLAIYDDLLWPLLMVSTKAKETIIMALQHYNPIIDIVVSTPDLGAQTAGYVFSSIPLLFVFVFGMKYYVQGITSGALKA